MRSSLQWSLGAETTRSPQAEMGTGAPAAADMQHPPAEAAPSPQPAELVGPAAALCGQLFDAVDADGSGSLEEAEGKVLLLHCGCAPADLDTFWADMLAEGDRDGDGQISRAEYLQYTLGEEELTAGGDFVDAEARGQLEGSLDALLDKKNSAAPEPAPRQGLLVGPAAALYAELFEAIDSDGSGFLDEAEGKQFLRCSGCEEAELDYYWADLVRSADTDGDGRVEKEELLTHTVGNEDLDASGGFVDTEQEAILCGELRALRSPVPEPAKGKDAAAPGDKGQGRGKGDAKGGKGGPAGEVGMVKAPAEAEAKAEAEAEAVAVPPPPSMHTAGSGAEKGEVQAAKLPASVAAGASFIVGRENIGLDGYQTALAAEREAHAETRRVAAAAAAASRGQVAVLVDQIAELKAQLQAQPEKVKIVDAGSPPPVRCARSYNLPLAFLFPLAQCLLRCRSYTEGHDMFGCHTVWLMWWPTRIRLSTASTCLDLPVKVAAPPLQSRRQCSNLPGNGPCNDAS